jgi:glycosyltransferase involved in cell wall biosynthesis
MRRVLIIAYYFPPIGGIGSIRLAQFASDLPALGWEPLVVAPTRTPHASDARLSYPRDRVVRARSLEFSRVGAALPAADATSAESPVRSARSVLRAAAHRYAYYPDAQVGWYPGAVRAARRAIKNERFDAVYSSSFPITAHLIARSVSRRGSLPWLAEFRDPWSDALPPEHPHKRRAAGLEKAIAHDATRLVMPTPTWAAHYEECWDAEISVVPNGYDDDVAAAFAGWAPPDPPVLTHLGSHYPGRQSFGALWEAVARLGERAPRIRVIGDAAPELRAEWAQAGIEHLVDVTGFVPHDEAMRLLAGSSVLFASGGSGSGVLTRGWIPAKLFEYLATGLPILYFGDSRDDAAQLLAPHAGSRVLDPRDADAVGRALEAELYAGRYERDLGAFTRRAAAVKLASVLDEIST